MKAIGFQKKLSISDPQSLVDIELAVPEASGHDILVKVEAIAVNPVDYKVRQNGTLSGDEYRVLGWDAVGIVVAVGDAVTLFKPGDQVFYAGDIQRQGSNAEYQLVDERIVGHKPKNISNADAAALPLTSITAWELLFEHLVLPKVSKKTANPTRPNVLLVVGAAGGVGSILVQLAAKLTDCTIIGTASRESSKSWVTQLGAHHVIDHTKPFSPQLEQLDIGGLTHIASLNSTDSYLESYIDALQPFGKIALIDDPKDLDVTKMKPKALSLHWEFMFARSMFSAHDMHKQGELLNDIAALIDSDVIKTTVGQHLGTINAANLRTAHEILESGKSIGKLVLEGF